LRGYAPQIRSERGIAFMLDVANQHGDGGAKDIIGTVSRPDLDEADLLAAVQQESVARVRRQFGEGPEAESTFNRRQAVRTAKLLADESVVTYRDASGERGSWRVSSSAIVAEIQRATPVGSGKRWTADSVQGGYSAKPTRSSQDRTSSKRSKPA